MGSDHFITKCSCGKVIAQCRCMDCNKTVKTIVDGCDECKHKPVPMDVDRLVEEMASVLPYNASRIELRRLLRVVLVRIEEISEVCPECNGSKSVTQFSQTSDDSMLVECKNCYGYGIVLKPPFREWMANKALADSEVSQ